MTTLQKTNDPISFKEAVQNDHWVSAMNEELEALELNQTWEIMQLPPGKHVIGCKWIYRTKYKPDGSVDKYKARLVILGCNQRPGEEFSETFAPVAKLTTVRTLLAVAYMQNWHIVHMDV
ncbi:putative mitochondrial protein AtMg00820 [Apium graveolens]|uniref:putative mitochondrial protein AtMg00820 n=1 Tax=Apium graveolens TaxID=4045 RepID=UPI003D7B0670